MRVNTSAARSYLVASALLVPAPYLMPPSVLLPSGPDKTIVWPLVAFGSGPLALVGLLLAALHERHELASTSARIAARAWGVAAVLTFWPLFYWLPPWVGYHFAGGVAAAAALGAAGAFLWLARDLWRRRLPGRWWVLVACLQVALQFGSLAFNWMHRLFVPSGGIDEASTMLTLFAVDCALVSVVLLGAHATAWRR